MNIVANLTRLNSNNPQTGVHWKNLTQPPARRPGIGFMDNFGENRPSRFPPGRRGSQLPDR